MKRLVDLVQLFIIAVILSPIYFFWQSERVHQFCDNIQIGMSLQNLRAESEQHYFNVTGLDHANVDFGKWQALIVSKWPLGDDYCQIKGLGDTVTKAKFIDQ